MKTLTIEHLKGYLGTGIEVADTSQENDLFDLDEWLFREHQCVQPYFKNHFDQILKDDSLKIALYPLSTLTEFREDLGFVPIIELEIDSSIVDFVLANNQPIIRLIDCEFIYDIDVYDNIIKKLYEWHIDIHGLIEQGLAIDKSKL